MSNLSHFPVLLDEVITFFEPLKGGVFVDCTFGGAGHFSAIYEKLFPEKIVAFDRDLETIVRTSRGLSWNSEKMILINGNFKNIKKILSKLNIKFIDGLLADLGTSTIQLLDGKRGFSFRHSGNLDMRMDRNSEISAKELVNELSVEELNELLRRYGEEKRSWKIANNIVNYRKNKIIETTEELVDIIHGSIGSRSGKIDSATRSFQALRIAVNEELDILSPFLYDVLDILKPGGRCEIISFHSLEDRIVKRFIQKESTDCLCDSHILQCICNHKRRVKKITKKPVMASGKELKLNSRSRSAKLRVFEKI